MGVSSIPLPEPNTDTPPCELQHVHPQPRLLFYLSTLPSLQRSLITEKRQVTQSIQSAKPHTMHPGFSYQPISKPQSPIITIDDESVAVLTNLSYYPNFQMSYLACTNKAEVRTSPLFPVTRVYLLFRACLNFRSNVTLNGHKYLNSKNYLKLCCKYSNLQNKSQVFLKKTFKKFFCPPQQGSNPRPSDLGDRCSTS